MEQLIISIITLLAAVYLGMIFSRWVRKTRQGKSGCGSCGCGTKREAGPTAIGRKE